MRISLNTVYLQTFFINKWKKANIETYLNEDTVTPFKNLRAYKCVKYIHSGGTQHNCALQRFFIKI